MEVERLLNPPEDREGPGWHDVTYFCLTAETLVQVIELRDLGLAVLGGLAVLLGLGGLLGLVCWFRRTSWFGRIRQLVQEDWLFYQDRLAGLRTSSLTVW
jgi:hypothetical protein